MTTTVHVGKALLFRISITGQSESDSLIPPSVLVGNPAFVRAVINPTDFTQMAVVGIAETSGINVRVAAPDSTTATVLITVVAADEPPTGTVVTLIPPDSEVEIPEWAR